MSNEQFPENELGKNSKLALYLTNTYIYDFKNDLAGINEEELKKFKKIADNDEWIKKTVSDLYRMISFSFIIDTNFKDKYLKKAKEFKADIEPIKEFKEITKLVDDVKKDSKIFFKEGRELNDKKYQQEIEKRISSIEVTSQDISFLLTLFSTLFLISGIIYSKLYFYLLGVNISDFFSINDYLASSIDTLIITFFSIAIGIIFYFLGAKDRLKTTIYEEQFSTESASRKKLFYNIIVISIVCIISFFVSYYKHNALHYNLLYPPILFVFFRFFWSIPIWQYFKNPEKIGLILMSFSTFIISLILTALTYSTEILKKEVKDDTCRVILNNTNIDTSNLVFITSNSSNVFMLDVSTKKVKIIPLYNIESIETKVPK
ncbi:hypothetical protein C0584_04755 [Candidatus Parcubacteria bacterium]|nr:MAG: hypothetical protein C0584_04755 [Candidatus Parcubacteria bacterium]